MNPVFTFFLGVLIGWLIEWLIDYFYWRRRHAERQPVDARQYEPEARMASVPAAQVAAPVNRPPDDLKVINGIGPVIARKLNEAGIFTFEQLGNLTAVDLRRILGNSIERLADEEDLLQQARDLARRN